jgi:hypothetical protein
LRDPDPDPDLRRNKLTRYMDRQADRSTATVVVPSSLLFFKERCPSPRPVECIFLQAVKI